MKPFYIFLLIIGIASTSFGVYMTVVAFRIEKWLPDRIDFGWELFIVSPAWVIGLLIVLFAYGKLKTINRTD